MKQEQFVARYTPEWQAFEHWLMMQSTRSKRTGGDGGIPLLPDSQIPKCYRRICQQLALARRRGYSPQVTDRLQQLMQAGHNLMYRTPPAQWSRVLEFIIAGFPQTVRNQATCLWISCALLVLPTVLFFVLLQYQPDIIYRILDPSAIMHMEHAYDPANEKIGRDSGEDWIMFGFYILNNAGIGLRTFASGLLAGVGTIFLLAFNGIHFGAIAGHLHQMGFGGQLWQFVAGHAPFELTAIVISGTAGLRLGFNLIAPGRRRRVDALIDAGRIGARLCLGASIMFFIAAFIEAFWSSSTFIPHFVKYAVSALLWMLVVFWLWRGGYGRRQRAVTPTMAEVNDAN